MADFEYFRAEESDQFSFFRIYHLHDRRIAGTIANVAYDSDKASL